MWSFFIILVLSFSWVGGQNGRGRQYHDHNGHGWDIKLAVPGEPGSDYPTLGAIPKTSFSCAGKAPGYYADLETNCQVFRICTIGSTYGFQSFLCPNGTLFNQAVFVCDWWMNVNCAKSKELFNNNNEKFGNLRLGPQLMKDIKKMLTHPMRSPYDKTIMKSNLIVMQNYNPPYGQIYPNAALLANTDRIPKNIYLPAQELQSPIQNGNSNDILFSASTPQSLYLPASFNDVQNTLQGGVEVFQRQKEYETQNNQFQKQQPKNIIASNDYAYNSKANNNNYSQITRTIQRNNAVNTQYGHKPNININPTITIPNEVNGQRGQLNQQNSQYDNDYRLTHFNSGKQQQYASNQNNAPYTYNTPTPGFSNEITRNSEIKQNLALVFSLLADSINIAKEYNNLVQQNKLPTPTETQFQNVNNEQLSQITNSISQLTSSHYSGNNYNNLKNAKIISTPQSTSNTGYQYRELTEQVIQNQQKNPNDFLPLTTSTPQLSNQNLFLTQYENGQNNLNANYQSTVPNQNQIYSGQLYQLPVPDVTEQIYNRQSFSQNSGNFIQSSNTQLPISNLNNNIRTTSTEIETVNSKPVPARLQLPSSNEADNIQETINKYLGADNTISAQIQDKIVGTIPHPLEDNKSVNYEKDQTYIVYSKASNGNGQTNPFAIQSTPLEASRQVTNIPNRITFQFIPSIGYQLENVKQQQKNTNAIQINEFDNPRTKSGQIINLDTKQNIIASDINYTVDHTSSDNQIKSEYNNINSLYAGPSSYSAPQSTIGNLVQKQNVNSRLELNDNNGYSKIIPERPFVV